MKTAVLAYLPKQGSKFNPESFIKNLRDNPPASPVIFFSDHDWPSVLDMGALYKVRAPEMVIKNTPQRKFNINNLLFLTGLKLISKNLADQGFTHFIFLECDCRAGVMLWDGWIIEEFKEHKTDPIVGGTVCLYSGFTGLAQERAEKLVANNTKKNFPVAQYRGTSAFGPCCFAMGAGAIYSIAGVLSLFDESELANHALLAGKMQAFDLEIGLRCWRKYGAGSFDRIVHLDVLYSAYDRPGGQNPTTEQERLRMLKDGSRVLIHQSKNSK